MYDQILFFAWDSFGRSSFKEWEQLSADMASLLTDPYWHSPFQKAASRDDFELETTQAGAVLTILAPGLNPDDIHLSILGQELSVESESQVDSEPSKGRFHLKERPPSGLKRRFKVGFPIKAESIQASYSHGVLRVELPRLEKTKPTKISINVQ